VSHISLFIDASEESERLVIETASFFFNLISGSDDTDSLIRSMTIGPDILIRAIEVDEVDTILVASVSKLICGLDAPEILVIETASFFFNRITESAATDSETRLIDSGLEMTIRTLDADEVDTMLVESPSDSNLTDVALERLVIETASFFFNLISGSEAVASLIRSMTIGPEFLIRATDVDDVDTQFKVRGRSMRIAGSTASDRLVSPRISGRLQVIVVLGALDRLAITTPKERATVKTP
jgi:hypothetical protein